jgi:hypothetical protein
MLASHDTDIESARAARSMRHFKISPENLAFKDIIIAEYLTFMEVMANVDIHIYI